MSQSIRRVSCNAIPLAIDWQDGELADNMEDMAENLGLPYSLVIMALESTGSINNSAIAEFKENLQILIDHIREFGIIEG